MQDSKEDKAGKLLPLSSTLIVLPRAVFYSAATTFLLLLWEQVDSSSGTLIFFP